MPKMFYSINMHKRSPTVFTRIIPIDFCVKLHIEQYNPEVVWKGYISLLALHYNKILEAISIMHISYVLFRIRPNIRRDFFLQILLLRREGVAVVSGS